MILKGESLNGVSWAQLMTTYHGYSSISTYHNINLNILINFVI